LTASIIDQAYFRRTDLFIDALLNFAANRPLLLIMSTPEEVSRTSWVDWRPFLAGTASQCKTSNYTMPVKAGQIWDTISDFPPDLSLFHRILPQFYQPEGKDLTPG
jgi:hypothetical protein